MEYKKLVKEIEKYVKNEVKKFLAYDVFGEHINPVRNYAIKLAKIYKADKEVVEIAALLHDIAHMKKHEHHDLVGAEISKKILKGKLNNKKIKLIAKCIRSHRGHYKRETVEEEIIFCADVMSHIDGFLSLIYSGGVGKKGLTQTKDRLKKEIEWAWERMNLPEAKKMVKNKYESIIELLKINK